MTQLVRYEAARSALAAAHRVDEVKDIRDKAEAMAAYARQAKDTELVQYATEIKVRAERRCGELLRTTAERGERATARGNVNPHTRKVSNDATPCPPTLSDIGLTRDESSRYQQLASMPDEHFETAVATAKATAGEVTTAFMLREAQRHRAKPKTTKKAKAMLQEMQDAKARGVSMLITYARLTLTGIRAQETLDPDERRTLRELRDTLRSLDLED